ncbi:MAG: SDR family oxidoreductase [Rhodobacteraceae bacterium]|nr:SDR family oxidoreductase [Paracoccaceae bacterium]
MAAETNGALSGKVAVVTGSSRNIGRAIALRLVRDGAAVVINGHGKPDQVEAVVAEIRAAGGRAAGCVADIADEAGAARLIATAVDSFGRLDILVNNAALRMEADLATVTLEDWHRVLRITLDGAFLCTRAAQAHLRASGAGTIVNIGGMTASTGARDRVHVVTAKAGLIGFTKALAWDLADDQVTANLVSPGMMDTQRDLSTAPARPKHHAVHNPLLGRRGHPEEVAGLVAWLCGPDGRFVTGQTLHVNGGTYLP